MQVREDQIDLLARARFVQKLDAAFTRDVPGFGDADEEGRINFLVTCLLAADVKGLKTEQGVASYALGAWWLGVGFEQKSRYLEALLMSSFPELRRVYAMNEWVHTILGEPENISSADEDLKNAFYRTSAWGGAPGDKR
jgi:hypothetical protein